jgi:hypothetical protein
MSAKNTLLKHMETELEKASTPKDFENTLDLSSEVDVDLIWPYHEGDDEPEGEEWDDALKQHIQDKFYEFSQEFGHTAEDKGSYLHVARCIGVKDVKDFVEKISKGEYLSGYGGVGIYWSWDAHKAECHWSEGGQPVVVHGLVEVRNIDIKSTLMKNLHPSLGGEETEIEVRDNSPIRILSLKSKDKMLWEGDQEVKAKSFLKRVGALK